MSIDAPFLVFAGVALVVLCTSITLSLVAMFRQRRAILNAAIGLALAVIGYAVLSVRLGITSSSLRHPEVVSSRFDSKPLFLAATVFGVLALLIAVLKSVQHRRTQPQ